MKDRSLVVVTAHAGDFVWRAGGAIALHARQGGKVKIVCLTLGVRGESGTAWSEAGATYDSVAAVRTKEAHQAAKILGAELIPFELDDYPIDAGSSLSHRIAAVLREARPTAILTHPPADPANLDHARTHTMALEARMIAIAPGHGADYIAAPQVYCFEPHQSELCDFKPNVLLDISEVWDAKRAAMEAMPVQRSLWDYYDRLALQRGAHAGRRVGRSVSRAEAYQQMFPRTADSLT
jgi:4-oxalomesaconate hydratase